MMEGRYVVVVTNLYLNAENIWRLYNRGTVVEQVIDELKNDFAATGIRTNSFWANDALFLTGLPLPITCSTASGAWQCPGN